MKKATMKQHLYLLPAFLIIIIFSLYPVIRTFSYTFFDYRLNDQQKSGLYLKERFNVDLFNETVLYINFFIDQDIENITSIEDVNRINGLVADLNEFSEKYKNKTGIIEIDNEVKDTILGFNGQFSDLFSEYKEKYILANPEGLIAVSSELETTVIASNFIGFDNYEMMFNDKRIATAMINTLIFTVASVTLEFFFGLGLALILNKSMKGQGLFRASSLIPWAIPTAVSALIWSYLYDARSGIVANLFQTFGLIENSNVLLSTGTGAIISTILADVWKTTPYMALLLLAGLQNISPNLYEASSIDGAGKIKSFFTITLPLLKPAILVALLFRTLDAFRVFDLIYVLTSGGPGGKTETISIYAYKKIYSQLNFGYGSVIVILMFICVSIIAIVFVKILGANVIEKE